LGKYRASGKWAVVALAVIALARTFWFAHLSETSFYRVAI
jgi:hypothetical protein